MGRVFLSAGHGGFENGQIDPGVIAGNTTEAQEAILIRDLVASSLRTGQVEALLVPDDLSATQTLNWINQRYRSLDSINIVRESHIPPSNSTPREPPTPTFAEPLPTILPTIPNAKKMPPKCSKPC